MSFSLRRLDRDEMAAAARIHRAARDDRLPWLAGRHSLQQDRAYFTGPLFNSCAVWGGFHQGELAGFLAWRDGWIDQLYVLPHAQRRGVGGALLRIAQSDAPALRLWTFQANQAARTFYERHGFIEIEETDGAGNEEGEPDILYEWVRAR